MFSSAICVNFILGIVNTTHIQFKSYPFVRCLVLEIMEDIFFFFNLSSQAILNVFFPILEIVANRHPKVCLNT